MRVVLDTNSVLSALVFSTGRLSWLRKAWQSGRVRPLAHRETVNELIRVLAYAKFQLSPEEIEDLLSGYLPYVEVVPTLETAQEGGSQRPQCRDPDDQVFLDLAAVGNADALITGDQDLLDLADQTPFEVLTPAALRVMLS